MDHALVALALHARGGGRVEIAFGRGELAHLLAHGLDHVVELVLRQVGAVLVARQVQVLFEHLLDRLGSFDLDLVGAERSAGWQQHQRGERECCRARPPAQRRGMCRIRPPGAVDPHPLKSPDAPGTVSAGLAVIAVSRGIAVCPHIRSRYLTTHRAASGIFLPPESRPGAKCVPAAGRYCKILPHCIHYTPQAAHTVSPWPCTNPRSPSS
ncbi:hypothetical protein D9M72_516740 [compost metagenome]